MLVEQLNGEEVIDLLGELGNLLGENRLRLLKNFVSAQHHLLVS